MAKRFSKTEEGEDLDKKRKIKGKDLKKALQIFRFVLPYKYTFIVGFVFLIASTLTSLSFPYLAGMLLDSATKNSTGFSVRLVSMIFFGILILQAIFSFFRVILFVQVSERAMRDIRQQLYDKVLSLSLTFFEKRRVGELISRINADVTQLQDVLSFTLAEFIRQVATLLIGISILLFTSLKLTLLMLSVFPIVVVVAIIFGRFIRKLSKKTQDALAEGNTVVEETLQSIQAVKSFTNEAYESGRYQKSLGQVMQYALQSAAYRGVFTSFIIFALFGSFILVLWYGSEMVFSGEITIGALTSFIIYTAFIGGAAGGMSELYAQIQRTVGASERILEILQEESEVQFTTKLPEIVPIQASFTGNIQFDKVKFSYPTRTDVEVLKGLSLEIKSGQKVAIVGYSGAGKSTIVQLINRFYPLQGGHIRIDGKDIEEYDITFLRKQVGIVPQEVILFGGTIEENIRYGKPDASKEEVESAALQANALEFIQKFPEGLQTVVGERGVKLSGGQRQRIAIARAVLKNPSILVLDEATSSLDANAEQIVQEALEKLMENRTTLIIAHRLATVRFADRIYVLNEGLISESGTHEELVAIDNGIYSNLVRLQMEGEKSYSDR